MIIYKSFYNLNVLDGVVSKKTTPVDFDSFVNAYIQFALRNGNNKEYNIVDYNSTVVHCVASIAAGTINHENLSDEELQELDDYSYSIAHKLLMEEQQAQEKIGVMGKKIKMGSLIQALIKNDDDEFKYIIAKVEHSEWYDGDSLRKNLGFPSEKKNVWKSAVFPMVVQEDILFDTVQVYTDNDAKYWSQAFLELNEKRNDRSNTINAFNAIEIELKRRVRRQAERDYYYLRNSVIRTLKKPQQINYGELLDDLLDDYQPDEPGLDVKELKKALLRLPESKKFDTQFIAVPEAIKKRRKLKFPVTNSIELTIEEGTSNYSESITAVELEGGKKVLQIDCHVPKTYELFKGNITTN